MKAGRTAERGGTFEEQKECLNKYDSVGLARCFLLISSDFGMSFH